MKRSKIIFLTLSLLILCITCTYGTSGAKYFSADDIFYSLKYSDLKISDNSLAKVGYEINYDKSTPDYFVFDLSIPRNDKWIDGDSFKDTSEVYVGNNENTTCTTKAIVDENYFDTAPSSNDVAKLEVKCSTDGYKDNNKVYLEFDYAIDGRYNLEEPYYEYISKQNVISNIEYADFIKNVTLPYIKGDTLLIHKDYDEEIDSLLKEWLKSNKYETDNDITQSNINGYINSYNSVAGNKKVSDYASTSVNIKGISVTAPSISSDYYEFSLTNSNLFKSYACTYAASNNVTLRPLGFYFYDQSNVNSLFLEYVRTFLYTDTTSKEYVDIKNYVDGLTTSGLTILEKSNEINGLEYDENTKKLSVSKGFNMSVPSKGSSTMKNSNLKVVVISSISRNLFNNDATALDSTRFSGAYISDLSGNVTSVNEGYYYVKYGNNHYVLRPYNPEGKTYSYDKYEIKNGMTTLFDFKPIKESKSDPADADYAYQNMIDLFGDIAKGLGKTLKDNSDNVLDINDFRVTSGTKSISTNIGTIYIDATGGKLDVSFTFDTTISALSLFSIPSNGISLNSIDLYSNEMNVDNFTDETSEKGDSLNKVELNEDNTSNDVVPSIEDDSNKDEVSNENDEVEYEIPHNDDSGSNSNSSNSGSNYDAPNQSNVDNTNNSGVVTPQS